MLRQAAVNRKQIVTDEVADADGVDVMGGETLKEHVSRQCLWQRKQAAAGRCSNCGRPRQPGSRHYCTRCLLRHRLRNRVKTHSNPRWRSHVGRPPITASTAAAERKALR